MLENKTELWEHIRLIFIYKWLTLTKIRVRRVRQKSLYCSRTLASVPGVEPDEPRVWQMNCVKRADPAVHNNWSFSSGEGHSDYFLLYTDCKNVFSPVKLQNQVHPLWRETQQKKAQDSTLFIWLPKSSKCMDCSFHKINVHHQNHNV